MNIKLLLAAAAAVFTKITDPTRNFKITTASPSDYIMDVFTIDMQKFHRSEFDDLKSASQLELQEACNLISGEYAQTVFTKESVLRNILEDYTRKMPKDQTQVNKFRADEQRAGKFIDSEIKDIFEAVVAINKEVTSPSSTKRAKTVADAAVAKFSSAGVKKSDRLQKTYERAYGEEMLLIRRELEGMHLNRIKANRANKLDDLSRGCLVKFSKQSPAKYFSEQSPQNVQAPQQEGKGGIRVEGIKSVNRIG